MVLGTTSDAGKSLIATALCRWYARRGLRVMPFKAQNMSNNARVVGGIAAYPNGGEIGAAQYFQALAAGVAPSVLMNPLLLKPEADTRSQVVLMGQVRQDLSAVPWTSRGAIVWPEIMNALDTLRAQADVVVIEGAGSPAEINLRSSDIVNMKVAHHAQAQCLLICDIDRGGAFAHLYGTWALLDAADRKRIQGFVLNKFRGDASLLSPAPELLHQLTGVPTVGVVPMLKGLALPEEDGWKPRLSEKAIQWSGLAQHVGIVAYPRASNLDEFELLRHVPGVHVHAIQSAQDFAQVDLLVLPGSKSTVSDLQWVRERGLDHAVHARAALGRPVIGICGGMQMLGQMIHDPDQLESRRPSVPGLGLLDIETVMRTPKQVRNCEATFSGLTGPFEVLNAALLRGYEIRLGVTRLIQEDRATPTMQVMPSGLGFQRGSVLGLYVHGLFESADVLKALFDTTVAPRENVFDTLADVVDAAMGPDRLLSLI
jgi:adenosylcobyric acid synthase